MSLTDLLTVLKEPVVAISTITTAIVAVVTALVQLKTRLRRSRLLKFDAFPLPEISGEQAIFAKDIPHLNTLLVGRDAAVTEVASKIRSSPLTFVYGESGSGKSAFLKLGLCRALTDNWIPIYVDVWGVDWESGPTKSLADATAFAVRSLELTNEHPPTTPTPSGTSYELFDR